MFITKSLAFCLCEVNSLHWSALILSWFCRDKRCTEGDNRQTFTKKTSELWWCANNVVTNMLFVVTFLQCMHLFTNLMQGTSASALSVSWLPYVNMGTGNNTHDGQAQEALGSDVHLSLRGVNDQRRTGPSITAVIPAQDGGLVPLCWPFLFLPWEVLRGAQVFLDKSLVSSR